jgi:hypothetical protein
MKTHKPRKVRPESVIGTMPKERQEAVAEYARTHTLKATQEWLAGEGVNLSVTSISQWLAARRWHEQFKLCNADVAGFAEQVKNFAPDVDESDLELFGNLLFQLQAIQTGDARTFLEYRMGRGKLALEKKRLALEARRVATLEKKAAQADATSTVLAEPTLTREEREQRLKEIYGRA